MNEHFNKDNHKTLKHKFNDSLLQSIQICEHNSDKIHHGGSEEEYWFMVLEELYYINHKLKEQITKDKKQYFKDFIEIISKSIMDLLEKMCSYVSMQKILNVSVFVIFKI